MRFLIFLILIPAFVFGEFMVDFHIYPIVAHQAGDKGTFWKTDCAFINHMDQKINVTFYFYPNPYEEIIYERNFLPMEVVLVEDIVKNWFEAEGTGFLDIDASDISNPSNPPNVNFGSQCRIYTTKEDTSTYGQGISNQFFHALFQEGSEGFLIGIRNNEKFRTNIGLACKFWGATIELSYYDENGELLGTEEKFIGSNEIIQYRFPYQVNGGYIKVLMKDSDFCWAYISIVDNISGDAVFYPVLEDLWDMDLKYEYYLKMQRIFWNTKRD